VLCVKNFRKISRKPEIKVKVFCRIFLCGKSAGKPDNCFEIAGKPEIFLQYKKTWKSGEDQVKNVTVF
jgi:hypothetical protein